MDSPILFPTVNYSALRTDTEIRFVILQQGSGDSPIQCRLFHAELGSQEYEALSYEWGDSFDDGSQICVDGDQVRTRKNLRDALWHMRSADKDRYIWVDALCINQADVLERNRQVQLMGRIYGEADRVIAWLGYQHGISEHDSDIAMDALARLVQLSTKVGKEQIRIRRTKHKEEEQSDIGLSDNTGTAEFFLYTAESKAVKDLATCTYWYRMWIIQETQLASELVLYCGTKSVPASALLLYQDILQQSGIYAGDSLTLHRSPAYVLLHRRAFGQPWGLHEWLYWCTALCFICSERRDVVYALLGISVDCQNGEIKPDYAKPLGEIYTDLFRFFHKPPRSALFAEENLPNRLAYRFGLIDRSTYDKNTEAIDNGKGILSLPPGSLEESSDDEDTTIQK
jgi:hypothetical protein